MQSIFARKVRLLDGWAENVRICVNPEGMIASLETGSTAEPGDAEASVLIPALANLHSHAFQRAMAGRAEARQGAHDSFWTWRTLMYALATRMDAEGLTAIAAQLYMELLKGGYGAVAEFHYLHNQVAGREETLALSTALIEAAQRTGIGLTLLPVLYQVAGFGADAPLPDQARFCHNTDEYLALLKTLSPPLRAAGHGLGIAFHSLRAVRPESFEPVLDWRSAHLPGSPVHIHIAEQTKEVSDCVEARGLRPVEWLLENCPVDTNWCLVHATHLTAGELERAARTGAIAGLCPTTEANLGDGFFDLTPWLSCGGRFGVGSDSQVSTSAVEELRLLEYGARLRERRRLIAAREDEPSTGAALWLGAAAGGAAALGAGSGLIEVGARADVIGLEEDHPALYGAKDDGIFDSLLFGPSHGAIRQVFARGHLVIQDGHHAQETQISADYRAALGRLMD